MSSIVDADATILFKYMSELMPELNQRVVKNYCNIYIRGSLEVGKERDYIIYIYI